MQCTFCRVHFDWKTLEVLGNSTNDAYRGQRPLAEAAGSAVGACAEACEEGAEGAGGPRAVPPELRDHPLTTMLEQDMKVVAYLLQNTFHHLDLNITCADTLIKLRSRLLKGEIDEATFGAQAYHTENIYEKHTEFNRMLTYAGQALDDLQALWCNQHVREHEAYTVMENLVGVLEAEARRVGEEYGDSGGTLVFRKGRNTSEPFVMWMSVKGSGGGGGGGGGGAAAKTTKSTGAGAAKKKATSLIL